MEGRAKKEDTGWAYLANPKALEIVEKIVDRIINGYLFCCGR